jgi:GMP synthase-like glutamine amidotransferase
MNILILQHLAIEHPRILLDFFREDGFRWTVVELDEGETIPELDPFDLMFVMGGPQDVWQEDQYPWFRKEKAAIRKFVLDMQRPYLGICLGHQLLADATGGRVGLAKSPEVGVLTISSTEAGRRDPLLSALPDPMTVFQWHGAGSPTSRPMPRSSPSRMRVPFKPSALANTPMVFNVMSKLPVTPSANGQPYRAMCHGSGRRRSIADRGHPPTSAIQSRRADALSEL